MNSLISIIVPVYNIAAYLPRCLDSILAQTHRELEVILVNDGSRDTSAEVIDSYAKKDSRVVAIHKENGGVSTARLAGLTVAHGEYIGFVDGDDEIEPDMYERLLANLKEYNADISHCGHQVHKIGNGEVEYIGNDGVLLVQTSDEALVGLLTGRFEPGLCNKLYKKELIIKLLASEKMDKTVKVYEDLLMNYYLFRLANKAVYDGFCPYHYMKREGSASTAKPVLWKYRDPVRVSEIICGDSLGTSLERTAAVAFASRLVHMYGVLVPLGADEFRQYAKDVRKMLLAQWRDVKFLSKKQKIAAVLIKYCPFAFRVVNSLFH